MIFGENPHADELLSALGLDRGMVGRFRDCYLAAEGKEIHLHTRCGGGNRQDYQHVFDALKKHPCYIGDNDGEFDSTYATIRFHTPAVFEDRARHITCPPSPGERWQKVIDGMKNGEDSPDVARALEAGKPLILKLKAAMDGTGPNIIEV